MKKKIKGNNKPIYKKWWVWVIIVLIIGIISPKNNNDSNNTDGESTIAVQEQISETKPEESAEVETSTEIEPEEKEVLFNVDWDKCIEETKECFIGNSFYDYVKDIYIKVDEDQNKITFTSELLDSATSEQALQFANDLVCRFNMNAQSQDESIENTDNYGKIYEKYSFMIGIATESQVNDNDKWYIYDAVSFNKGKIELQNK